MAIIRSYGALQSVNPNRPTFSSSSHASSSYDFGFSYAVMYRTQPNIRKCVDFLSRNIAQLGLHAYRRKGDDDRERLSDHEVSDWLRHPNPRTTRYRLMESTMGDLGVFFNAYWLKVRTTGPNGRPRIGLVRMPARQVSVFGEIFPVQYEWNAPHFREPMPLAPSEVIHFSGYDPDNAFMGLSPIETLRRILLEDIEQHNYRRSYYRNSARVEGVIERPREAGKWTDDQRRAFKEDWRSFQGSRNAGRTPVLEDGMIFKATTHSAKDQELTAARKLTAEESASAYHIPLPMVGILDHATFSNVKEQHKQLYSDTLGPWNVMIEEQLEKDLVTESKDSEGVYLEFNIAEKLKGTFEEQAAAIQSTVGRPIATLNEGRARMNLPRIDPAEDPTADQVMRPLNMGSGDEPDPATEPDPEEAVDARRRRPEPEEDEEEREAAAAIVARHHRRYEVRLEKVAAADRARVFGDNATRYRNELMQDLEPILGRERAWHRSNREVGQAGDRIENGEVLAEVRG